LILDDRMITIEYQPATQKRIRTVGEQAAKTSGSHPAQAPPRPHCAVRANAPTWGAAKGLVAGSDCRAEGQPPRDKRQPPTRKPPMAHSLPTAQGLYDPKHERDACLRPAIRCAGSRWGAGRSAKADWLPRRSVAGWKISGAERKWKPEPQTPASRRRVVWRVGPGSGYPVSWRSGSHRFIRQSAGGLTPAGAHHGKSSQGVSSRGADETGHYSPMILTSTRLGRRPSNRLWR